MINVEDFERLYPSQPIMAQAYDEADDHSDPQDVVDRAIALAAGKWREDARAAGLEPLGAVLAEPRIEVTLLPPEFDYGRMGEAEARIRVRGKVRRG